MEKELSLLLIDDNEESLHHFSQILKDYCSKRNIKVHLTEFTNFSFNDLTKQDYDIAFLDIDMPGISGFEVAQHLKKYSSFCNIVYVSAKTELVFDSFDYSTVHNFIPKGCTLPLIHRKLNQIFKSKLMELIPVSVNGISVDLQINKIIYLKKEHNDLYIYCSNAVYRQRINLNQIINVLNESSLKFVQVHKSIIVNLDYIINFKDGYIELSTGKKILVSRTYRKHFLFLYESYKIH